MIFVTVGSMFPFDRMIRLTDEWSLRHPTQEVFAQIGSGTYEPKYMRWQRIIPPNEYRKVIEACTIIVGHAGTGSVLTAAEFGKPIVLIPRRAAQKEHTTDHQLDTAKWLQDKPGIFVAWSDDDLACAIEGAEQAAGNLQSMPPSAPQAFLQRLRSVLVR